MHTKIVTLTVCILLGIVFAESRLLQGKNGGNFGTCVLPYLTNITDDIQEVAEFAKETITVLNGSIHDIKSCFDVSGGSGSGSSGAGSAAVSVCLTYVSAELIPQIQNLTNEYQSLEPKVQKLQTTIMDCLYPSSSPTGP